MVVRFKCVGESAGGFTMTTRAPAQSRLLRNSLLANAAFSGTCGLCFVIAAQPISGFLGWSLPWVVPAVGAGLLAFALLIVRVAVRHSAWQVKAIVAADIAWVVMSGAVLMTNIVTLTTGGRWGIGIIADIVALFALLQFLGLRQSKRG